MTAKEKLSRLVSEMSEQEAAAALRRIGELAVGKVRHGQITDPDEAHAAIDRATSRIKTNVRFDFVRSVRGR